jgi:regulator of sigma E protease
MNFLLGLTLVAVIVCFSVIPSTTVAEFKENATSLQSGLQVDDKIVAVQGIRVSDYTGMATQLSRCYNQDTLSLTVERNGQEIILQNVTFPTEQVDEGLSYPTADFLVYRAKKTPGVVIKQIFLQTGSYVTGVINSLSDMITGRISLKYVSGPVGISSVISEAASYGFLSLLSVAALISVNLGVMNILPLPALDGGRFLCLFIEAILRRPIPAKVEGIIHAAGLLILLAIMVLVAFKDLFFPI